MALLWKQIRGWNTFSKKINCFIGDILKWVYMINHIRTMSDRYWWIYYKQCFLILLYIQVSNLFQKTEKLSNGNIAWIMNELRKWQKTMNKKLEWVTKGKQWYICNTKER